MGQSHEFPVINFIFSQAANRYAHAVFVVDIQFYLRTVVFFHVLDELLRCTWQIQFLRKSFEVHQFFDQLFFGRFLFELNENCCGMSVQNRNTDALAGDDRALCRNDHAVFHFAPQTKRLHLALFLLRRRCTG